MTSWFDECIQYLKEDLEEQNINPDEAILKVETHRDELTVFVDKKHIRSVCQNLRDDQDLRFEMCFGVSGVHYPNEKGSELHACYHFMSITHKRQIRLEVTCSEQDPRIPTIVDIYPGNDWHERETWDLMGIIFEGHPSLTRTAMPDDWEGHPQRKDYPLGGVNIEYKGARIPPVDKRRKMTDEMKNLKDTKPHENIKIKATLSPGEKTDLPYIEMEDDNWGKLAQTMKAKAIDRAVVSIGPVHPSTHGVLRIVCEIEGETITDCRVGTGYLHTGIEKNMEYRTWTQGVTYCTRMDYVAPLFQEVAYCLGVEKLLGVKVSTRADAIRVLMMELNRIASHLVAIGTGGNELGATTMLTIAFRARENILRILEHITGLRMNHAYIRPGGVAVDIPEDTIDFINNLLPKIRTDIGQMQDLTLENPIFKLRQKDVGYISLSAAMALGLTGPCLRATGLPMDMRKLQPYCGYETYDFKVPVTDKSDSYNRTIVRFDECYESLRLIVQAMERLATDDSPVMLEDEKWDGRAELTVGKDGQGNDPKYVDKILGTSMESLIHHFKMISQGFNVPKGQVYSTIEHAKGVMGVHLVSDGGNKPYRAHFRDPSFSNLQSTSIMSEGGQIADFVVTLASLDPVLGGVDR